MAKYRCPECGASHKELEEHCRLCGAPIANPVIVRTATIDKSVSADRFRPKGIGHYAIIGVVIIAVIALAGLALGVIEGGDEVDQVRGEIPVLGRAPDAWFDWADPDEVLIVEVPAKTEEVDDPFTLDDAGTAVRAWTTSVGDVTFIFGYTEGLDFDAEDDSDEARQTLTDAANAIAEQSGGTVIRIGEVHGQVEGHPGIDASYQGLFLAEGPAFGHSRVVLADGELFFVFTVDYEESSDFADRIEDSMLIVADYPDLTIPTIPPDAAEPGGAAGTDGDDS